MRFLSGSGSTISDETAKNLIIQMVVRSSEAKRHWNAWGNSHFPNTIDLVWLPILGIKAVAICTCFILS